GRTIWRRWSGYRRRSRAETTMNCMKLLGHKLMTRGFDRQTVELQVRIVTGATVLDGVDLEIELAGMARKGCL
ncbi:IS5/IS1182 family transposase, partial [Rhodovulum sulfidophilum]|nr:IS5/IS1182 family transposase [Rhodovulum sulfidophilum]